MNAYRFLADVIVVLHAVYVLVVIGGLLAILLGIVLGWRWIGNFWFRAIHLAMIGLVAAEAVLGIACPLTTLESSWRAQGGGAAHEGSFVGYWVHELLFYRAPPWVFTLAYCAFCGLVLATWIVSPPRWPWRNREAGTAR